MRTMTATEASRAFSALLDEAERGETIVVTRGGKRVAVIAPSPANNGSQVIELLASTKVDPGFDDDVRAARDAVTLDGPVWPAD